MDTLASEAKPSVAAPALLASTTTDTVDPFAQSGSTVTLIGPVCPPSTTFTVLLQRPTRAW